MPTKKDFLLFLKTQHFGVQKDLGGLWRLEEVLAEELSQVESDPNCHVFPLPQRPVAVSDSSAVAVWEALFTLSCLWSANHCPNRRGAAPVISPDPVTPVFQRVYFLRGGHFGPLNTQQEPLIWSCRHYLQRESPMASSCWEPGEQGGLVAPSQRGRGEAGSCQLLARQPRPRR